MKNKLPAEAIKKLSKVKDVVPSSDVLRFCTSLLEAAKEDRITKREIAKIVADRDVALHELRAKYALLHTAFERIFDERKSVIDKHFELIDRGIQEGKDDIVLGGMKGLSEVVAASPFSNLGELRQVLESGRTIDI